MITATIRRPGIGRLDHRALEVGAQERGVAGLCGWAVGHLILRRMIRGQLLDAPARVTGGHDLARQVDVVAGADHIVDGRRQVIGIVA